MNKLILKLKEEIKKFKSKESSIEKLKQVVLKENPKSNILKYLKRNEINPNRICLMEEEEIYGKINIEELNELDNDLKITIRALLDRDSIKIKEISNKYKDENLTKAYLIKFIDLVFHKIDTKILKSEMSYILKDIEGENLYIYSLILAIEHFNNESYIESLEIINLIYKHMYYDLDLFTLSMTYRTLIYLKFENKDNVEETILYLKKSNSYKEYIRGKFYELGVKDIDKCGIENRIDIINEKDIKGITKYEKDYMKIKEGGVVDIGKYDEEERYYLEIASLSNLDIENRVLKLKAMLEEKKKTKNIYLYKKILDKLFQEKYIKLKNSDLNNYYKKYLSMKKEIYDKEI